MLHAAHVTLRDVFPVLDSVEISTGTVTAAIHVVSYFSMRLVYLEKT